MSDFVREQPNKNSRPNVAAAFIVLVLGVFIFVCLVTLGSLFGSPGEFVANFFLGILGYSAYPIVLGAIILSLLSIFNKRPTIKGRCTAAMVFMLIFTIMILHLATTSGYFVGGEDVSFGNYLSACYHSENATGGGAIIGIVDYPIAKYLGVEGFYILTALLFLVALVFVVNYFVMSKRVKDTTVSGGRREYPIMLSEFSESAEMGYSNPRDVRTNDDYYGNENTVITRAKHFSNNRRAPFSPQGEMFIANIVDEKKYMTSTEKEKIPVKALEQEKQYTQQSTYLSSFQNELEERKKYSVGSKKYVMDENETIIDSGKFVDATGIIGDPYIPKNNMEVVTQKIDTSPFKIDINQVKKEYPLDEQIISAKKYAERKERERREREQQRLANTEQKYEIKKQSSSYYNGEETILPVNIGNSYDNYDNDDSVIFKSQEISQTEQLKKHKKISKYDSYIEENKTDLYDEKHKNFENIKSGYDEDDNILEEIKNYMNPKDSQQVAEKPIIEKPVRQKHVTIEKFEEASATNNSPFVKLKPYIKPPINLLRFSERSITEAQQEHLEKSHRLEETLQSFKIEARVKGITQGPTVTRYELFVASGVPVKKILGISDDIAMRLESEAGVRIQAPIPGKNLLGIEIPNRIKQIVSLRDVIDSREFFERKSNITFALGEDITGEKVVCDLQKMPHLLIAGSTGAGKSACLNSLLISMIYASSPQDLRFILIDPKRVEFNIFNGLPHLLLEDVICDNKKALSAFNWAINEMERRYELFQEIRIRDIDAYNQLADSTGEVRLPKIVIIVDELADLLLSNKIELEEKIKKLTQKARAAGIHLILATQRPSVDVITGVIKSNLPSRIAFRLPDPQSSKTVINVGGAEKLLGSGDMLYSAAHLPSQIRIQGAYVSTDEVKAVVDYVISNNEGYFSKEIEKEIDKKEEDSAFDNGSDGAVEKDLDAYFIDALKLALAEGYISISMIQRRFSVGHARAGKIIDTMERFGYITGQNGAKPRGVNITRDEFEELYGAI